MSSWSGRASATLGALLLATGLVVGRADAQGVTSAAIVGV
jgi:hypothetical protein